MVIIAFIIMVVVWGAYSVYGIFFNPLISEFGWTRAMTSGAFSLSMILSGVLGMVMGGLTDRFGPRIVMTISCFLFGLGHLLMWQVSTLWQLYLFYGVIVGVGMGGSWVPMLSSLARWFSRRRSLMTGIVVSGLSIGRMMAPPVTSRLISIYDWRFSYVILGSTILLVTCIASQFLRRDPTQVGLLPYSQEEGKQEALKSDIKGLSLREAVYTSQFWLVFTLFFCFGFNSFSVWIHIVPYAAELNISAINAANIISISSGVSILGNFVLGGIIGDRIGNRRIIIICFTLISAIMFWLVLAREVWMLYLFAAVSGLAIGGIAASEPPLLARLFGLSSHGLILGFIGLGFTGGAAIGPLVTGYIFDLTASYQVAFQICAAFGVVGIIIAAVLRPTKTIGGKL